MLATIEPAYLTMDEQEELLDHEETIEMHETVFLQVGNALMAIRDAKLYRASHPTFDAYLAERWPAISKRRGYQLIDAAAIAKSVPITNERQARALKGVPIEQAKQAFDAASKASNGAPSGKAIEQALQPERHASGLPVDFSTYEAKALACNLRLVKDGMEYYVTGSPDGRRSSSQWSVVKSFIDASEKTYQLQAQALAATQRIARVQAAQATLTTPIADAYAAGREAELERSYKDELATARTLQNRLCNGMHNLDSMKQRIEVRGLCNALLNSLNRMDSMPTTLGQAVEAVLTHAADILSDYAYSELRERLETIVTQ